MHGKDKSSKAASTTRVADKIADNPFPDLSRADLASLHDCNYVPDEVNEKVQARIEALRKWHEENDPPPGQQSYELPVFESKPWDFLRDEKIGVVD